MTPLKEEWEKAKGKLTRFCRVCKNPFKPQKWNQTLCEKEFCKQGAFLYSHLQASIKRYKEWEEDATKRGISIIEKL